MSIQCKCKIIYYFSSTKMPCAYLKCNFPLPHVFGLRRLRTAIRLVRFGYNTFTGCVA